MSFTLLIVDDSATTRALIRRTVQISGLVVERILEAGDGKEALKVSAAESVDLILTDLNMPVMGGAALTQAILADPATKDIPVVVVSADPNPAHRKALEDIGVRGFIKKPFTPEQIRDVLESVMKGVAHA